MLVINKTRSMIGRRNPLDPDNWNLRSLGALRDPLHADHDARLLVNGIVMAPISPREPLIPNATEMLNFGGVIGYRLYILIEKRKASWLRSRP